jgi:hypothetical protein
MTAPVSAYSIEPGRYVAVRTAGLLAWLIRRATRSAYNHVFLADHYGKIIEATPRGIHRSPLSEYAGHQAVVTAEPLTAAERARVLAMAGTMLGDFYNWPGLAAIGLSDLGWHWKLLFRLAGGDGAFFCSQTAAVCGASAGLRAWLCGQPAPDQVTPGMLAARDCMVPVTWDL